MLGGHTVSFWKGQKKFYSQNKSQIAADRMARSFGDFISKGCQPAPSGFFYAGKFHSVMALLEIFKKENGYG
jgi:hypothetical protein